MNKEQIIKQIIENNKGIFGEISIENSDEQILNFLYDIISKDSEYRRYSNVTSFYEYILYLSKDEAKNELVKIFMKKILSIKGVAKEFLYIDKDKLKCIFNNDDFTRCLCNNLIEYCSEDIYSFNASFYSYELCISYLCKYYDIFNQLFEFEERFLHLLKYSISYSGESGDTGYAYKGLEEVRNKIHILGKELIVKLLDCFDGNSINNSMIVKQILAIINASGLNKEEQKELKFFYIDAKSLEDLISDIIEMKIIYGYDDYISVGEKESIFKDDRIIKTIINKVYKSNSRKSIKFIIKNDKFLKKDFIVEIDGQEEYKLMTILYKKDMNIIQLVDENKEILNFTFEFRNSYAKFKLNSEDYTLVQTIVDDKFQLIDNQKISNDHNDKIEHINSELDNGIVKYDTTELDELTEQLQFSLLTEKALKDAKVLIEHSGAANAVDRIHTALHAYLKTICKKYKLTCSKDDEIRELFKLISTHIFNIQNGNNQDPINLMFSKIMGILHELNNIRNRSSLAHPNELLNEAEARFVIDSVLMILKYLNYKLSEVGENHEKDSI